MAAGFGVPQVDFYSQLSGLGDTLQQNAALKRRAAVDEARKGAFSDFTALDPSSPDYGKQAITIAQRLGTAGDQEGAVKFLGLAQSAADRTRQATRDAEADRHTKVMEGFAGRTANRLDEDKFAIKDYTDANGNTGFVKFNPRTGEMSPAAAGIVPTAPNNPFAYGKQNEAQSKDSGYANRMFDAEKILRDPKVIAAGTSYPQAAVEGIPLVPEAVKNWAHSPEYQRYDQAQRNMINAILRRESGAAISQSEFDNAYKQYIPRPGDSSEKLVEKQRNRQAALAGIAGGGGQSYRPPYTFGPNGELQPTGNPAQGATPVRPQVPPAAIDALKKDPRLIAQFDEKYGQGAARAILAGGQ